MHRLRMVVGYFPKLKIFYAKIVKNPERAEYWKAEWQAHGAIVATDWIFYTNDREAAYKALKEQLVKEIKKSNGSV